MGDGLLKTAFWKNYVLVCRPQVFFVAGTSALAGLAFASRQAPAVDFIGVCLLLSIVVASFYGLYRGLASEVSTSADSASPLERGEVDEGLVLSVSGVIILIGTVVLSWMNLWNLPLVGAVVVGSILSAFLTRYWWSSLVFKPAVLCCIPLMAWLTASNSPAVTDSFLWLVLSVFFTGAVYVVLTSFASMTADREAGNETLPIMLGSKAAILVSLVLTAFAFFASVAFLRPTSILASPLSWNQLSSQLVWGGGFLILFSLHYFAAIISSEKPCPDAKGAVRALVLIRCGEAAAMNQALVPLVLVVAIAFEISQVWEESSRSVSTE